MLKLNLNLWRVKSSNNNPYPQINYRKANIPDEKCKKCISRWLVKEIESIKPKAIVTFGEEVYQQFKQFIVEPNPSCIPKLSTSKDKSIMDAEKWQYINNCSLKIKISGIKIIYYAIRHPGNYGLRKDDIRRKINSVNISRINEFLKEGQASEDKLL